MKSLEQKLNEQDAEIRRLKKQLGESVSDSKVRIAMLTESESRLAAGFREVGLSEKEAELAAAGKSPRKKSGELKEAFRAMGLSEKEAELAASGR